MYINNIRNTAWLLLGSLLFLSACVSSKKGDLTPENNTPVYSVAVEDATEASLIEQEVKVTVLQVSNNRLYYYDENNRYAEQLKQLGYGETQKEDLYQVYKKYQKLLLKGVKDSLPVFRNKLQELKITLINQEKDHWVVYGNLAALNQLKKQGYSLQKMDYEVRPREVEIQVNKQEDVQKISELGIDIHSAQAAKTDRSIIIHGSAFDHQIEAVKAMGFTVKIIKPRI